MSQSGAGARGSRLRDKSPEEQSLERARALVLVRRGEVPMEFQPCLGLGGIAAWQ